MSLVNDSDLISWCRQFCDVHSFFIDIDSNSGLFASQLLSSCYSVVTLPLSLYNIEGSCVIPNVKMLDLLISVPICLVRLIDNVNIDNFLQSTAFPPIIFTDNAISQKESLQKLGYAIHNIANTSYYLASDNKQRNDIYRGNALKFNTSLYKLAAAHKGLL